MFGFKSKVRDYDVDQESGIGGTHGLWQMYDCLSKKNKMPATVWVLDKRALEKTWFKKDTQGMKTFLDYMRREAFPTCKINLQIHILEPLEEDSSYMIYVTNRVQTTLFSLLCRFGDLETAKRSQAGGDPALQLLAPDLILYGFSALVQDLAALHDQSLTFGSLTPANIAILPSGEWCLVGFAMCENNALQYEFNDDTNAWFRPSAWCMTPRQVVGKYSNESTDCAQLFFALFSCFGNRALNFSDNFTQVPGKKFPEPEQSIENLTGKLLGVCPPFQNYSISPAIAGQNANLNERFWGQFAQNSSNYYCLGKFANIMQMVAMCAQEKCASAKPLNEFLQANCSECKIMAQMTSIMKAGGFQQERPAKELTNLIYEFYRETVYSATFSAEFLNVVLLKRIVQSFCCEDLHPVLIPLLIKLNATMQVPKAELFLLFEPIVISCTKLAYRTLYEKASKTADFSAFTGIELAPGRLYRYKSPYLDLPLDRGYKEKDRGHFCPSFDEEIDSEDYQKQHEIIRSIYESLEFFFCPETGGRSHCYTLNLIMSAISSQNTNINTEVFEYLEKEVALLADENWMLEEDMALNVKLGNTFTDMGKKMENTFEKEDVEMDKKTNEIVIDHKRPITNALTPCMIKILKVSENELEMMNIMICLGQLALYFTDEEIGRVLLPQINGILDNIQKYPKAIFGFAMFARAIYQRCSGRTIAGMFMPRLLKMLYIQELQGSELDGVRTVIGELWEFISEDCLKKDEQDNKKPADGQQSANPAANAPDGAAEEEGQYDENYESYDEQGYAQQQPQAQDNYDPYAAEFTTNTTAQDNNFDPWGQGNGQGAAQDYEQADYSTSNNYEGSAANPMDW